MTGPLRSQVFVIDDLHSAIEFCYDQGWTDGLPVVPPTVEKVQEFLDVAGRRPDEVVFEYLERSRVVTVEKVAINAVMAGCRPEYFPVVLALIEAIATPEFGIHPVNASTGGSALGFVVNGPIRQQIGMNCQGNVLGPGNRANSTIGRAVRLTQINAMGSTPGAGNDLAADGGSGAAGARPLNHRPAGQYAGYHLAEYEEAFPDLEPLHVTLGFEPTQNVGTVFPPSATCRSLPTRSGPPSRSSKRTATTSLAPVACSVPVRASWSYRPKRPKCSSGTAGRRRISVKPCTRAPPTARRGSNAPAGPSAPGSWTRPAVRCKPVTSRPPSPSPAAEPTFM